MNAKIKFILFVSMVFTVWSQTWADTDPASVDSCAHYELLTEYIYDFGDVDINCDSISAEFLVKSTGNVPMIILGGSTSCTCTNVSYSQDIISPSDTLMVRVTYHPFVLGTFKQSAVVRANTEPYSYFWLYIKGNVVESKQSDDLQDGDD